MNIIDLICLLPLAFAVINGFRKGLVIEIASLLAFILAIIACLKLTHWVMELLHPIAGDSKWLPFISYLVIFIGVYILVLWIGKLVEKAIQVVQLGLFNRVLGMIFSTLRMCFFISLVFWMLDLAHLVPKETKDQSITYKALHHFAADTITFLSNHIPVVKGEIDQVEHFFDKVH
jgi:membrane protein required for colicin V production